MELTPQLLAFLLLVLLAAAAVRSSPTPEATAGHAQQACAAAAVRSSPTPEAIQLPSTAGHAQACAAAAARSSPTPEAIQLPRAASGHAQACAVAPADPAVNDRPVIGIVTHPGDGTYERRTHGPGSYIAASYVRFVQSAGARVIPLLYDEPEERLLEVRACFGTCLPMSLMELARWWCFRECCNCFLLFFIPFCPLSCRNWVW
jgi:gamma-glutamyl hydrolase